MKIDEKKDAAPDTVSAQDQQNRREFFNGLGKWSMIVIATVSFLRGSVTQIHAAGERTGRREWEPPETASQRLAEKWYKHGNHHVYIDTPPSRSLDKPHGDVPHVDARIQPGDRGGQPSGQPPAKISE
jgi:hypothetical protein